MGRKIVHTPRAERVDSGVRPHIRSIAAMPAELNIIDMRGLACLEDENQLVLRSVQAPLACIRFDPNDDVFEVRVHIRAGGNQFANVAPVDKNKMNRSVYRMLSGERERSLQEPGVAFR